MYDPFVGSGSIAVALSHFTPFVVGSDLDLRVLNGSAIGHKTYKKNVKEYDNYDIFTNFEHYGLMPPEIFVSNIHKPSFRPH